MRSGGRPLSDEETSITPSNRGTLASRGTMGPALPTGASASIDVPGTSSGGGFLQESQPPRQRMKAIHREAIHREAIHREAIHREATHRARPHPETPLRQTIHRNAESTEISVRRP
jgi:hypothetical protein